MKIYFGPYSRWWHPRRIMLPIKWAFRLNDDQYHNLLDWFSDTKIGDWLQRRCYRTEQKVSVRIDDYDAWNMCDTLALIIHPMLVKLKENKHGAGRVDDDDVPENIKSTSASPVENTWDTDDFFFDRWDWVLDEMIFAFGEITNPDRDDQFSSGNMDLNFVKLDNGYSQMVHGENHTYKVDEEAKKVYYDRIQNGLRLFGKYYFSLWD